MQLLTLHIAVVIFLLTTDKKHCIFTVFFVFYCVFLLNGRQPVCVGILVKFKKSSQIFQRFLSVISINKTTAITGNTSEKILKGITAFYSI